MQASLLGTFDEVDVLLRKFYRSRSNAICERAMGVFKRVKPIYLRANVQQQRVSGLALLPVSMEVIPLPNIDLRRDQY